MTLREFSKAYYDKRYANSTVPVHAQPRKAFSDGSANELTRAIVAWFEFKGIEAWRQATEGRHLAEKRIQNVIGQMITVEKGRYIPRSKKAKGGGDITATLPPHGRRLEIEVKHGKDRLSDDQKAFQKRMEAMGAIYIVVKTWDDFIFQITKIV